MKSRMILAIVLSLVSLLGIQADDHADNASVYVIHGIQGNDLGLDQPLAVDIAVNDACLLTAFSFGQVTGPLSLQADTYNIKIGLADAQVPCSSTPVIEADVTFAPGEVAVVLAHLSDQGDPTASKFSLDDSPLASAESRINVFHAAAAPAVDIRLRSNPCSFVDETLLSGVTNGMQAALVSGAQTRYLSFSPAFGATPVIGPLAIPIGLAKAYHVFAVGSLDLGSLTLLTFKSSLTSGAAFEAVPAMVNVIHGIPGQDLNLPPKLPVDISLNGVPALTDVQFGAAAGPIALGAGVYKVEIAPANLLEPGSEPALIEADVVLIAGDSVSIVAHLTENGMPSASVFPNQQVGCDIVDHPIFVHHAAYAPTVDVVAKQLLSSGFREFPALHGVNSGDQGLVAANPGDWKIKLLPAGTHDASVASYSLSLNSLETPFLYAVGSLANGSLSILEKTLPRFDTLEALALQLNSKGDFAGAIDTLLGAVLAADPIVLQALAGSDPLTVFAPTDEAFAALGLTPENVSEQDPAFLTDVLLTHVVAGSLSAESVLASSSLTSLQGSILDQNGGVLTDARGGQANIVVTDLRAGNGVIHVIDAVVLPAEPLPSLLDLAVSLNAEGTYAGVFDTLIAAVLAADESIAAALAGSDPLTVFAPTDDAFAALGLSPENISGQDTSTLTEILLTHVVAGSLLAEDVLASTTLPTLQGTSLGQSGGVLTDARGRQANIVITDVRAANGVIHVIDAVVLPPEPQPSLLDLAVRLNSEGAFAGVFDTLIAAVTAADASIASALSGSDLLTVFAPTDDAFAALDLTPETIGSFDPVLLTDILLYHVSTGKQLAADVLAQSEIQMLKGGTLGQSGGVLTDNLGRTANIIVTDVEAANGVIHAIDAVVLPVAP